MPMVIPSRLRDDLIDEYKRHWYKIDRNGYYTAIVDPYPSEYVERKMMFASRKVEGENVWRLCVRRGRVIQYLTDKDNTTYEISFPNYTSAKTCSDMLNDSHLEAYSVYVDRDNRRVNPGTPIPVELRNRMIQDIGRYATMTKVSKEKAEDSGTTAT